MSRVSEAAADVRTRFPCPVCGSTTNPKFDDTSAWCAPCTQFTLMDQDAEDAAEIVPEVFG